MSHSGKKKQKNPQKTQVDFLMHINLVSIECVAI